MNRIKIGVIGCGAIAWDNAFVQELRHFHACISTGATCRTSIASARDDIVLIIDIIRRYGG